MYKVIRYFSLKRERLLSKNLNMQETEIKTYVFFDSETTGLPYEEHNKTRITELCFAAVQSEHISLGVFPRILPKINLCFNPRKLIQPGATEVSGLTNELLEAQPEFNVSAADLLYDFLNIQRKPICLVAHNGNRFDYPILRAELHKAGRELPEDILCVDSLTIFRHFYKEDVEKNMNESKQTENIPIELQDGYDELLCSVLEDLKNSTDVIPMESELTPKSLPVEEIQKQNETTPHKQGIVNIRRVNCPNTRKQLFFENSVSFKLGNLYELLTQKSAIDAHKAEYDVAMLIECITKLGQRFIDWSNINASRFCDIPMMRPGKAIGM